MNQQQTIYGYNAVAAAIARRPDDVIRLHFIAELAPRFGDICKKLAATRRIYRTATAEELEIICKSSHHGGVVLITRPMPVDNVSATDITVWKTDRSLVLAFDNVGNTHNMGAMIRSAAFLGVRHVLIESNVAGSLLTSSATRVAEGGMEHVKIRATPNLAQFIRDNRSDIPVIGTDQNSRIKLADVARKVRAEPRALMLVMGNEEHGLSPLVRDACSEMVSIPGRGIVESLNVVTAASICMYELCQLVVEPSNSASAPRKRSAKTPDCTPY